MSISDVKLNGMYRQLRQTVDQGGKVSGAQVQGLLDAAKDGGKVTPKELGDLNAILQTLGTNAFEAAALNSFQSFLGGMGAPPVVTSDGTLRPTSPLMAAIKDKALRNALGAMLADGNISTAEAQRIVTLTADGTGLSRSEKKDVERLLDSGVAMEPAARVLLGNLVGRSTPFMEPVAAQRIAGSALGGAYTQANAEYRTSSLRLPLLARAGVPENVLLLLDRARALANHTDDSVSAQDIRGLESATLTPSEKALLPSVWALMKIGNVNAPAPVTLPAAFGETVVDKTVRPAPRNVDNVSIQMSALPVDLREAATRAVLISKGASANTTKVTLADVNTAIHTKLDQSTDADRQNWANVLVPALRTMALDQHPFAGRAATEVPTPGQWNTELKTGSLKFNLVSSQSLGGIYEPARYDVLVGSQQHQAGYGGSILDQNRPGESIQGASLTVQVKQRHVLVGALPAGSVLMLVPASGEAARCFTPDEARTMENLPAGAYRTMLFKDGKVAEEGSISIPALAEQTLPNRGLHMDGEFVTKAGAQLHFANGATVPDFRGVRSQYQTFTLAESGGKLLNVPAIQLKPGAYQVDLGAQAYPHSAQPVELDVIDANSAEVVVNGQRIVMTPAQHAYIHDAGGPGRAYPSHDEVGLEAFVNGLGYLYLNPSDGRLLVGREEKNTYHTATSWDTRAERHWGGEVQVTDKNRVG